MNWRTLIMPVVKLYWRIFKPKTFGVKVLIFHPKDKGKVLLVRHSYGNKNLWNFPGGGYCPKKETAIQAAKREVQEELFCRIKDCKELCVYKTSGEGKRDTVSVIMCTVDDESFKTGAEIDSYEWVTLSEVLARENISRVVRHAIFFLNKIS